MADPTVLLDQEAADGFKRFRLGALLYLALALVCAALAAYAYRLENPTARVAQARVTGFEKLGGEERLLLLTEFVDAQGRTRTTPCAGAQRVAASCGRGA